MKPWIAFGIAVAAAAGVDAPADADPGPASEVYSPAVARGLTELEVRSGFLNGGAQGDWQVKAEASHAVTDWWRPALVAEWAQGGGETRFTAFAVESVFDLTATREWPVHLGAYVEYEWANDGPNELELKLLLQRQRGPLDLRLNLIGARLLGSAPDDNWEFGYAAQALYAFNDDFALGVQGFGDAGTNDNFGLNDQAHYWGPFAQIEAGHFNNNEIELQLGYLAGFGHAEADGVFRVKLEVELGGRDTDD
ncbi:MAG: hypothetical protein JSS00_09625 [Proteobacteria bacterium]|nr:hypothetical protein [Pseudomonadota bacterium]